jgi:hypothetical protein
VIVDPLLRMLVVHEERVRKPHSVVEKLPVRRREVLVAAGSCNPEPERAVLRDDRDSIPVLHYVREAPRFRSHALEIDVAATHGRESTHCPLRDGERFDELRKVGEQQRPHIAAIGQLGDQPIGGETDERFAQRRAMSRSLPKAWAKTRCASAAVHASASSPGCTAAWKAYSAAPSTATMKARRSGFTPSLPRG